MAVIEKKCDKFKSNGGEKINLFFIRCFDKIAIFFKNHSRFVEKNKESMDQVIDH